MIINLRLAISDAAIYDAPMDHVDKRRPVLARPGESPSRKQGKVISAGLSRPRLTRARDRNPIQELANLFPNSVFEIDLKGRVVFANAAGLKVFGRNKHDLKAGFTTRDVIAPEDFERARRNIKKILEGRHRLPTHYLGIKKDGTRIPVLIQAARIVRDGKAVGARGVILETAELQQAHDVIVKAKEALENVVREQDVELKISVDKLRRVLEQTISAFSAAIEKRDPYTAGHQQRTAVLATAIAREMKLEAEKLKTVYMAALVHDIGKISVPAEILNKPTKLTDLESHFIKMHATVGHEILNAIEFPWPIARVILEHHEHLDGSGYPNGLKGAETLLESKILSVADVVEAMASHRPYRPALGIKKAVEEISAHRGTFYDPDVVTACLRIISDKPRRLWPKLA